MIKKQDTTPILDAAGAYAKQRPVYFCIPGHRYENGAPSDLSALWGDEVFKTDLTETPLTDDLHDAQGPILDAQKLSSELWGADSSYFLVNGSSCGIQAMIMTCSGEDHSICIARNAHKSAFAGLVFSGARPVYAYPNTTEYGFYGGIDPKEIDLILSESPDCKAVLIVSPTYHGVLSDIKAIADVCHSHGAALLVDEAHGSHLYFSDNLPKGALQSGADACVQSIHKTAGALTQSSLLHVKGGLINRRLLESNLRLVQTSSPSYLLMSSLDAARKELALNGKEMAEKALELSRHARKKIKIINGLKCAGRELVGTCNIFDMDETRLVISAQEIGISGFELKEMLFCKHNIDVEFADDKSIVAIITYANSKEDIDVLINALESIAKGREKKQTNTACKPIPRAEYAISPRKAYFSESTQLDFDKALGKISAEMIAPYPPGIPVLYPGEIISKDIQDLLINHKKNKGRMHGPSDPSLDTISVIE